MALWRSSLHFQVLCHAYLGMQECRNGYKPPHRCMRQWLSTPQCCAMLPVLDTDDLPLATGA